MPQPFVTAQSFGSGSSGNALLISTGRRSILVDCGVGIRKLRAGLADHGISPNDLDAILITHEHRDHVQALPRMLHDDLPIVATEGTRDRADLPDNTIEIIGAKQPVDMAGATIHALNVRHDAVQPVGFHIEIDGATITVLTDLGCWQDHLVEAIACSDLVLIEANYNDTMLRHGPYPAHLKRRVASMVGHLGNDACGAAITSALRISRVETTWWLSHLSQTNNSPRQAERDVREIVNRAGFDARIAALPRRDAGPIWRFDPTARMRPPLPEAIGSTGTAQLGLPGLD